MSMPTLPQALYKANLDLWLRIGELLEDNRTQWTALLARELEDGATGASVDMDAVRQGDWQSLALLPAQAMQRLASHGLGDLQAAAQTALGSQMNFATGFQAALADWQQATAGALGEAGASEAVSGGLQAAFAQALQGMAGVGDHAVAAAAATDAPATDPPVKRRATTKRPAARPVAKPTPPARARKVAKAAKSAKAGKAAKTAKTAGSARTTKATPARKAAKKAGKSAGKRSKR